MSPSHTQSARRFMNAHLAQILFQHFAGMCGIENHFQFSVGSTSAFGFGKLFPAFGAGGSGGRGGCIPALRISIPPCSLLITIFALALPTVPFAVPRPAFFSRF